MGGFFIWLSGADTDILADCKNLKKSERTRFAGMGALILVPALLGTWSMAYAISTLTPQPAIYVTIGIIWGVIVMMIDRYLVSTLYKSKVTSRWSRAGSIIVRYIFAIFVGIAVSHPLVMLWFQDSITQQLTEQKAAAITALEATAKAEIKELPSVDQGNAPQALTDRLTARTDFRDCLIKLQTDEQAGNKVTSECGSTSGDPTCQAKCNAINDQIDVVTAEIATIQGEIDRSAMLSIDERNKRQAAYDASVTKINEALAVAKADTVENFATDYLARVEALGELGKANSEVKTVTTFMILFFVFVDILPVTMKLATPKGEYDYLRDSRLIERVEMEEIDQNMSRTGVRFRGRMELEAAKQVRLQAMEINTAMYREVMSSYTDSLAEVGERTAQLQKQASRDPEVRSMVIEHMKQMRELFNHGWRRTFDGLKQSFGD